MITRRQTTKFENFSGNTTPKITFQRTTGQVRPNEVLVALGPFRYSALEKLGSLLTKAKEDNKGTKACTDLVKRNISQWGG